MEKDLKHLEELYSKYKSQLWQELQSLKWESVVMEFVEFNKNGKTYEYVRLRGMTRERRWKVIQSHPVNKADIRNLKKQVYLYKLVKALSKAIESLNALRVSK
ncbi:MAG: hypothetical protein QXS14_05645 [Desulfurococcaceae archaeon]